MTAATTVQETKKVSGTKPTCDVVKFGQTRTLLSNGGTHTFIPVETWYRGKSTNAFMEECKDSLETNTTNHFIMHNDRPYFFVVTLENGKKYTWYIKKNFGCPDDCDSEPELELYYVPQGLATEVDGDYLYFTEPSNTDKEVNLVLRNHKSIDRFIMEFPTGYKGYVTISTLSSVIVPWDDVYHNFRLVKELYKLSVGKLPDNGMEHTLENSHKLLCEILKTKTHNKEVPVVTTTEKASETKVTPSDTPSATEETKDVSSKRSYFFSLFY